jgi:integrase
MIQLWPFTIEAIDDYINTERVAVLSKRLANQSNGFLFLSEKGEPFKHRASITDMFSRLGIRLAELGLLEVGDDPYFPNVRKYDFCGSVLRHSSATLFLKHKGTDDRAKDQMKPRFGWTHSSNMPERYAARTISDQANINLMEFSGNLIAEAREKKQKQENIDGL